MSSLHSKIRRHVKMMGKDELEKMLEADVERTVVIDLEMGLVGFISIGDIIRGHQKLLNPLAKV